MINIKQINTLTTEEVKSEMEKAKLQKRIEFEFKHRRKDGSIRDVEVFSSNIPNWKQGCAAFDYPRHYRT